MNDTTGRTPAERKLKRRAVLGLAATAVGAGVVAWRMNDGQQPAPTDVESTPSMEPASTSTTPPTVASSVAEEAPIDAVVGEDGFDITLGTVRVSAPSGVAPTGTKVSVSQAEKTVPDDVALISSSVGQPVRIVLGDGQQPQKPITITFDLGKATFAGDVSDEAPLVVFSRSENVDTFDLMAGTWNVDTKTFTVSTNHLSIFDLRQIDLRKIVSDFVNRLLGLQFPKPTCAYQPLRSGTTWYSIDVVADDSIWPCIRTQGDEVIVDLHSNSFAPWAVKSLPSVRGTVSGSFKDIGPGLAAFYQGLYGLIGDQRTAVMPGNTATLRFSPDRPPTVIGVKLEPGLFLASTLLWAVQTIFETMRFKAIAAVVLESFEAFDCLLDVINTTYEITDELNFTGIIKSILTCIKDLINSNLDKLGSRLAKATVGVLISIILGGGSLIAAGLFGAYRTLIGKDEIIFTISSEGTQQQPATGVTRGPSLDQPIIVKWRYATGYTTYCTPAVANGVVYVGSRTNTIYAIEAETGFTRWTFPTGDYVDSSPIFVDGVVYVGSQDNNLYALNADDGSEAWRFSTSGDINSSPAVVAGLVYFGSNDGNVYAIDTVTQQERWRFTAGDWLRSDPKVVDGVLYVGSRNGFVYALDAKSGQEHWRYDAGGNVSSRATVVNGVVYVGSGSYDLHAIDASTGTALWRFATGSGVFSSPAVVGGVAFFGSNDGNVYGVDTASGSERWRFQTGDVVGSSPAVADGILYVGSNDGNLYAIDTTSGQEIWRLATEGWLLSSPTVVDGVIYVGSGNGEVFAIANLASDSKLVAPEYVYVPS